MGFCLQNHPELAAMKGDRRNTQHDIKWHGWSLGSKAIKASNSKGHSRFCQNMKSPSDGMQYPRVWKILCTVTTIWRRNPCVSDRGELPLPHQDKKIYKRRKGKTGWDTWSVVQWPGGKGLWKKCSQKWKDFLYTLSNMARAFGHWVIGCYLMSLGIPVIRIWKDSGSKRCSRWPRADHRGWRSEMLRDGRGWWVEFDLQMIVMRCSVRGWMEIMDQYFVYIMTTSPVLLLILSKQKCRQIEESFFGRTLRWSIGAQLQSIHVCTGVSKIYLYSLSNVGEDNMTTSTIINHSGLQVCKNQAVLQIFVQRTWAPASWHFSWKVANRQDRNTVKWKQQKGLLHKFIAV